MNNKTFMISGCGGQIGVRLLDVISKKYGPENTIACDINGNLPNLPSCVFYQLDVRNY
jgi:FlaA1/EpsC-like NDP-sugar epimerase